jgi:HlyD family secretion protein
MIRPVLIAVGCLLLLSCRGETSTPAVSQPQEKSEDLVIFASPGRIEGNGAPILVGADMTGIVESLLAKQGDHVNKGDVVARIHCKDLDSELSALESDAEVLRQTRVRLVRGSRLEEREAAAARVKSARANLALATSQFERLQKLYTNQVIPQSNLDEAIRSKDVAESEMKGAEQQKRLTDADPLPEDLANADAKIEAAAQRAQNVKDRREKCIIKAPITGIVLRTNVSVGELLSTTNPQPILTLVDGSKLKVRAEVDERDVARVNPDTAIIITADGYPGRRFTGHVVLVTPSMGRKQIRTPDPAERADRDILEVVGLLDPAETKLPIGLRVTVQFLEPNHP